MLLKSQFIIWSIAGVKAKVGSNPFIKCATGFPLILWHPYARHHYFCVMTEKEQKKWHAVLQDCVRDSNNGNNANTKQHINRKWQKRLESQRLCEVNAIRIICTSSEHEQCFSLSTLANLSSSVPLLAGCVSQCEAFTCHLSEQVDLCTWNAEGMGCICFVNVVAIGSDLHSVHHLQSRWASETLK